MTKDKLLYFFLKKKTMQGDNSSSPANGTLGASWIPLESLPLPQPNVDIVALAAPTQRGAWVEHASAEQSAKPPTTMWALLRPKTESVHRSREWDALAAGDVERRQLEWAAPDVPCVLLLVATDMTDQPAIDMHYLMGLLSIAQDVAACSPSRQSAALCVAVVPGGSSGSASARWGLDGEWRLRDPKSAQVPWSSGKSGLAIPAGLRTAFAAWLLVRAMRPCSLKLDIELNKAKRASFQEVGKAYARALRSEKFGSRRVLDLTVFSPSVHVCFQWTLAASRALDSPTCVVARFPQLVIAKDAVVGRRWPQMLRASGISPDVKFDLVVGQVPSRGKELRQEPARVPLKVAGGIFLHHVLGMPSTSSRFAVEHAVRKLARARRRNPRLTSSTTAVESGPRIPPEWMLDDQEWQRLAAWLEPCCSCALHTHAQRKPPGGEIAHPIPDRFFASDKALLSIMPLLDHAGVQVLPLVSMLAEPVPDAAACIAKQFSAACSSPSSPRHEAKSSTCNGWGTANGPLHPPHGTAIIDLIAAAEDKSDREDNNDDDDGANHESNSIKSMRETAIDSLRRAVKTAGVLEGIELAPATCTCARTRTAIGTSTTATRKRHARNAAMDMPTGRRTPPPLAGKCWRGMLESAA